VLGIGDLDFERHTGDDSLRLACAVVEQLDIEDVFSGGLKRETLKAEAVPGSAVI